MMPQASHTSVFTFQSAVHSAHVLQCLNEQRQQDILCDVTVVVENKSFRAHCSVLASCCEYFCSRIPGIIRQNPIISLPEEVTVEGFEPLLQFAYTSKLLFTKENIHAIRSSAEFLGFRNLESACFDFLIPKFSESEKSSQKRRRGACCRSCMDGASFDSGTERGGQAESFQSQSSGSLGDFSSHCPLSGQVKANAGEEHFCLENCGPQMAPSSLEFSANSVCPVLSAPCQDKADHPSEFSESDILQMGSVCSQSELSLAGCSLNCQPPTPGDVNPSKIVETLGSCPLKADEENCVRALVQSEEVLTDKEEPEERSRVEREVAEHLAKGFWSDLCPSQIPPDSLDSANQNNLSKGNDFHWFRQLDLSSSVGDCPFLRDLGSADDPSTQTDCQSEKSPYISSSFNSGDESDLDTDADAEANNKRAAEIQLPFPVEQISELNRSAFQQLLRDHRLTPDQLDFVHDVRRRSKNRVAAQRCRKRKLDGIQQLECEIKKLKSEKECLLLEQNELQENLKSLQQSLRGFYKSVNTETGSDQDHTQLFTKLSAPDFHFSCTNPEEQMDEAQTVAECGQNGPAVLTGSEEAECSVPASLLSACLDMTNTL